MNDEEKNLLKVQLVLNYYKKDITDRYMRCIENIVLDNDVLNVLDERVYITTLDKYNKLQNNWNELKKWLEEEIKRYRNTLSERPTNDIEYNNSCVTSVALEQVKVVLSKMQELEDMNGQKSKNVK